MKKTIAMLALAALMSVFAFGQNPPASDPAKQTTTPAEEAPMMGKKATKKAKKKAKKEAKQQAKQEAKPATEQEAQPASEAPATTEKKAKSKKKSN